MPTYNVHLYREMRLPFLGIEADTPEQAAKLVAEYPSEKAESYEDCEGVTLAALVDLVGDKDYSHSVTIDLDPMKSAALELYEACQLLINRASKVPLRYFPKREVHTFLGEVESARITLAKARGETLPEAA